MSLQRSRSTARGSLVGRPSTPGEARNSSFILKLFVLLQLVKFYSRQRAAWQLRRREMAPQGLEKIESAPGNGMVSEASNPQHLVRGRAADLAPLRLTSRNVGAQPSPSLRDKAKPRNKKVDSGNANTTIDRHCEEPLRRSNAGARSPCDEAMQGPRAVAPGLLRCARNDGGIDATIIGHRLSRAPPAWALRQLQKKAPN